MSNSYNDFGVAINILYFVSRAGVCVERESGDCRRRVSAEDLLRRRSRFEGKKSRRPAFFLSMLP